RQYFFFILTSESKALTDMLENFADYLSTTADNLQDICFTASTGRSHYNHRLAFTGKNKEEILSEINKVISDGLSNSSEYGTFNLLAVDKEEAKANDLSQARFNELSNEASQLIKEKDLSYENIADLFVKGADIEWYTLYKGEKTVKVSLPLYPYEKKRCWISYPEPAEHNNVTVVDQPVLSSPKPTKKKVSKRKGVLENLKGIISGIFEMSVEEVDTNTTFFEMGLDSISIIQVRQLVKNTYNLDIPIDRLFDDVSNLQSLADFIDENIVEDVEETVEVQETEFSADSGDGYIKNVIDQQLALMEKQLKLLSGGKDVEVGTKKVSKPALPAPKVEKRPVNKVENQPETDAYTESQLAYLKEFFKRYAEKTKSSKKKTQDTRSVYANNRNVAGYRSLFKEIMYPILADKAKGATITDVDNNEYVDFCLGFGVYLLGYNHPAVKEAIDYQNDQGVSLGAMSSIAGEVAQLIVEMTGVERVAFYNSGTEAIMVALRLARAARSRSKVVMFQGSYHGTYDGVLVQKDVFSANHKAAPKATGIPAKMLDDVVLLDYGTEESLQIIEEMAHDLAAVLVEPVQSRRPEFQPKEYLQKLRELTEDTGVPLIFDEIITGFRMHSGGTQALFDIKADLVTYGKIIGGGLPIGVVAGKAEFMHGVDAGGDWSYDDDSEPFFDHRKTFVAGTFCTHPLTMAASRAILRYLKEQGGAIQDKLNERTHKMATELNTFFERNDFEIEIVNFGSLFQIRTNYDLALVIYHLIERGIYAWEGMTFFISEAHSPEQVNFFIENFKSVIVELREKGFIPSKEGVEVNTTGKGSELERLELTIEQQQLVTFLNIEQNSNDAFKIFKNETIEDAFDEKAFNQAAQELANRHEILRAHHVDGDSLIFDKGENISIDVDDLDSSVESIEEWIGKKRNEQINVFEGPLVRFSILRVDQKSFVFTLTAHQIIVDGYSIQILLKEIGELYFTFLNGQKVELPVPARFSDYTTKLSNFLASEDGRETIAYWERELKDEVSNLVFPNNPYSDQPGKRRGESYELDLGVELTSKLKQVGKQSNVSLFMLLLGLYEVFVYKITNQKKFVIGTPVAGQLNFDFDYLVGQCALIIPSLVNVELELTSLEFLKKLKKQRVSTLKYQKVSYDALSHFLSETVKMPEIQAMFNLDSAINSGQIATGNEGPSIKTKDDISSKYDLFLNAIEVNNSLRLNFQIDHSKFDADLFKGWVNGFLGMINNLINQPHIIVTNLWNNQEAHSITTCEINLPLQNQYITDYQEEASQYFQEQSVVVKNDASQSVPNGVYGKVVCLNDSTFIESPYHGRLLQDGTLELLGKSEDLITLNGFACDRTVVEGIVNGLKGVEQSHIISLSTKDESTRSSYAVFVKGSEQNKLTLEAELKDALPLHLTPELIIPIEELPFDKNGNVLDDKLLAIAVGEREEARESDTIELLKDLFKEVLNQAHIKSDDNFFDLGGNSLKAVQLIARINKHFNKSIGIKDVFANPTVVKMDRIIESSEHADFSEIVRVEGKELHPVSHAQKRLWILDQFRDNKTAYLMPKSYLLTGKLDEEKFEETFKLLIARHESLNTVFVSVDGIPMQKINDSSNFHVTFEDLSADSKAENKFKTYAKEEAQTPFDLSAGPLVRAKLLKLEEEKFGFLFTIHHIVGDGWSMEILMRDFAEIYNGLVINGTNPLSPLPVQYKDYTHWLDGQLQNQLEIDKEFWHEKFSGDIPVINLPTDKKRPAFKTSNGAVVPFQLTKEAGEFIKNTSDKCKT
ncbi:MAG: aminotransferase class III-fold pyridoxal phosphate-dependent enzyme, partial [Bacteroidota bacterium]